MLQHTQVVLPPQPAKVIFTDKFENIESTPFIVITPKFLEEDDTQDLHHFQTLKRYVQSSPILKADLLKGSLVTLYGFAAEDAFKKAYVLLAKKEPRRIGAKLARAMQGIDQELKLQDYQKSTGHLVLPKEYTSQDVNQLLFAFQLANYRFQLKSGKISKNEVSLKGLHVPICNLVIAHLTLTQQAFEEQINQDPLQKIFAHLPQNILRLRGIVNQRANIATIDYMLDHIKGIKNQFGDLVELEIIQGNDLLQKGLNLLHAVGRAGKVAPALACLSYKKNPDQKRFYALIGKGIVFDSGGLSIKGSSSMETMFDDKTGACTVLEAFRTIVELGLAVNVVCTVALAENSVGSDSYRVSDIIQSYKGLTVEILNTDAEGRLVLADAMSYTQDKFKVKVMIELSTLTGGMKSSIGLERAGLFTNKDGFAKKMQAVANVSEENFWRLPLTDEFRNQMKQIQRKILNNRGSTADLNNAGGKTGSSCAAAFLENFVEAKVKWMHWDIAAMALSAKDHYIYNKGASGFGLQSILFFIMLNYKLLDSTLFKKVKKLNACQQKKEKNEKKEKKQQEGQNEKKEKRQKKEKKCGKCGKNKEQIQEDTVKPTQQNE